MDMSLAKAGEALQFIEEYYPRFLTQSGMEDCQLARVAFYGHAIESISTIPLPDHRATRLLFDRLTEEYRNAQAKLQDELFQHLLNGK
jgi:hypothetical protein